MFTRMAIVALLLTGTVLAAPAPPYRRKPPPIPTSGGWVLNWGGTQTVVLLGKDGGYRCRWSGGDWQGSWGWDAYTRTLHICETIDGRTWLEWYVQLDDHLCGEAVVGIRRVSVTLRKTSD
jgi:hypothetical protein